MTGKKLYQKVEFWYFIFLLLFAIGLGVFFGIEDHIQNKSQAGFSPEATSEMLHSEVVFFANLSPLEKWTVDYVSQQHDYDLLKSFESTTTGPGNWTAAEEFARGYAFYQYATNPESRFWIEIRSKTDTNCRWRDYLGGDVLEPSFSASFEGDDKASSSLYPIPESGWLELQILNINENNEEVWRTSAIIYIMQTEVITLLEDGYFSVVSLPRIDEDLWFLAKFTFNWSEEDVLSHLP